MNVLSKLLDAVVAHGVFSYHPKFKKINLTHLCFVNDLLIFAKGNVSLVKGIYKVMQVYYAFLGLQLNSSKSELFSTRVRKQVLKEI